VKPADRQAVTADAALVATTAVWGASFVVVKDAVAVSDPLTFLALRFALGALALTLIARGTLFDRALWRSGGLLGVLLFLGFLTQTAGLQLTTPSRSGFLTGLSVLLVPFVSLLLFRRWPTPPVLLGVLLAGVGLWFLTGGLAEAGGDTARGDLLTVACAVAFAFHIVLLEPAAKRFAPVPLVASQLWTVAALSSLALIFVPGHLAPTPGFWGAVAFSGLLSSAGCILAQTWAQARTTAVRAALIFALEPVFAAAFSVAVGRERLGNRELVGGSLIVLGIVAAELGSALWTRRRPLPL
jgi:drug/metabolite transporter (DMT)-like permease